MKGKKSIHFQNKMAQNLEILGGIHKKNSTLLQTSLQNNFGNFSSLPPKK